MNYKAWTVKEAMKRISQNEIYLPAIQRKFVWGPQKIEMLFDSLMRGYPIGTFLFWFVHGKAKDEYTFYKFIQDYHERDNPWNQVAPKPDLRDEFIGVLDGQQRLNSMYVALQGSYADRRRYGRWEDDAAFPQRHLYVNLFYQPKKEDESGIEYEFSFLSTSAATQIDAEHYWFKVKDAIGWADLPQMMSLIASLSQKHPEHAAALCGDGLRILTLLWQRLCKEDIINYFSIQDEELDRITDIFIRVNSTGIPLSKTDLLFSSIVAHWDEGRANIENAISSLNGKGAGFFFDNDFLMRSCLVLSDLPVRLKVNSFKRENISRIRTAWPKIVEALDRAVDLLVEWGVCGATLPGNSAVILIAYFIFKEGDVGGSKSALRQYLVRSQVNQVFSSRTDQVLTKIRDSLRVATADGSSFALKTTVFSLADLLHVDLPNDRSFNISPSDVEELLRSTKGAHTFLVLSLLYPQLRFNEVQFHQDHIHPWSLFTESKLKGLGIDQDKIAEWQGKRDQLPNLQLMEGSENQSKNAKPFREWLRAHPNIPYFLQSNFISEGLDLELNAFDTFFEARKALLGERLFAVFDVVPVEVPPLPHV